MALTMTRTRTQTTLTKLAELVANVHGELAFLEGLVGMPEAQGARGALDARRMKLVSDREALYATLRQFDAGLDPEGIGASDEWRKQHGRRLGEGVLARRYLAFWAPGFLLPARNFYKSHSRSEGKRDFEEFASSVTACSEYGGVA